MRQILTRILGFLQTGKCDFSLLYFFVVIATSIFL